MRVSVGIKPIASAENLAGGFKDRLHHMVCKTPLTRLASNCLLLPLIPLSQFTIAGLISPQCRSEILQLLPH